MAMLWDTQQTVLRVISAEAYLGSYINCGLLNNPLLHGKNNALGHKVMEIHKDKGAGAYLPDAPFILGAAFGGGMARSWHQRSHVGLAPGEQSWGSQYLGESVHHCTPTEHPKVN